MRNPIDDLRKKYEDALTARAGLTAAKAMWNAYKENRPDIMKKIIEDLEALVEK